MKRRDWKMNENDINKINKLMEKFGDCTKELNKGNSEFHLILRNGAQRFLASPSRFSVAEYLWSFYEESIKSDENAASKGIYEIFRLLNDLPMVRSLKREIGIYFLPVNCFDNSMKEIAELASKMSRKRGYINLRKYIGEIKSRKVVNLTEGRAKIEGGDFTDNKAPKAINGRVEGPTFSIKIHYISSSSCEVEVFIEYLKEEFGDVNSHPSIDIDDMFEGRVFTSNYYDEGNRKGINNDESIYFRSRGKAVGEALKDVIDKIRKHYSQHSH